MGDSRLTPLQRDVLEAFFRREKRFFLTGGAALAGFYLGHRETEDLDLFVASETLDILDEADAVLAEVATELSGTIKSTRTFRDYRRRVLARGSEAIVLDLVRDPAPQLNVVKAVRGVVRLDTAEEIFANKLGTLLSRSELRDLVDVRALELSGLSLEKGLVDAATKDAGLTPATLSWVLGQLTIPDDAHIPSGLPASELRAFLQSLRDRLDRMAFPR